MSCKEVTYKLLLDGPTNWQIFIDEVRRTAMGGGGKRDVWKYINPQLTTQPQLLPEPIRPKPEDFQPKNIISLESAESSISQTSTPVTTATLLQHGQEYIKAYQLAIKDFEWAEREFTLIYNRLDEVQRFIRDCLTMKTARYLTKEDCTPWAILNRLQKALQPKLHVQRRQVQLNLTALKTYTRGKSIEEYLDEWNVEFSKAVDIGLHNEDDEGLCYEFIYAVSSIDLNWSDFQLNMIEENPDRKLNLRQLINNFRSKNSQQTLLQSEDFQRIRPNSSFSAQLDSKINQGAQFQGHSSNIGSSSDRIQCPCNGRHPVTKCWYLVNDLAPAGWAGTAKQYENIRQVVSLPQNQKLRDELKRNMISLDHFKKAKKQTKEELNAWYKSRKEKKDKISDVKPKENLLGSFIARLNKNSISVVTQPSSSVSEQRCSLYNHWTLDNASNTHVINDIRKWKFELIENSLDKLTAGATEYNIQAYGNVILPVTTSTGEANIKLNRVAYVPGFMTNLVSLNKLTAGNVHWNSKFPNILTKQDVLFCKLFWNAEHWTFHKDTISNLKSSFASSKLKQPRNQKLDELRLHQLLGHPSIEVIKHSQNSLEGITLMESKSAPSSVLKCEVCSLAQAHRINSKRSETNYPANRPFDRIQWDYTFMAAGFDGSLYKSHIHDTFTLWKDVEAHHRKTQASNHLIRVCEWVYAKFGYYPQYIRLDGETSVGSKLVPYTLQHGIEIETSAPYTQAQNGGAEVVGRWLSKIERSLRIESRLPHDLWPELSQTAAYLSNITPIKKLGWKTPFELVNKRKPLVGHIEIIGSKAFVLVHNIPKLQKLAPRAMIGYLVGYDSTNIFRVWIPSKSTVVRIRDVKFDSSKRYSPEDIDIGSLMVETAEQIVVLVETPKTSSHNIAYCQESDTEEELFNDSLTHSVENIAEDNSSIETSTPIPIHEADENANLDTGLPSPENTPTPELKESSSQNTNFSMTISKSNPVIDPNSRHPITPRHNEISSQVDERNIIEGPRTRKSTRKAAHSALLESTAYYIPYHQAFASGLKFNGNKQKIHRDNLPTEPKNWNEMLRHKYVIEFKAAANREFDTLLKKSTFCYIDESEGVGKLLPFMWVFKYKFDSEGLLEKYKARLVARGDMQEINEETYAATLAAQTFRALMAITTTFDLEIRQYDAVNAFVNASLPAPIYMTCPEGYKQPGKILKVTKAVYGLKVSPLYWFQHLTATFEKLSLRSVPSVNCLCVNDWISIFYVDDILAIYHKYNQNQMDDFEKELMKIYELRVMGEASNFLNVRIVRERNSKMLYLLQDDYIDSLRKKYSLQCKKTPKSPLSCIILVPNQEKATKEQILGYQQKLGSLNYAACITRPDIAFSISKLSEFAQNPSSEHIKELDNCLLYVISTQFLALSFNGSIKKNFFSGLADASYADDPLTRWSSNGFVFMLFGGAVHWKATKQRTVVTSSTHSELLAISFVAKEYLWWLRLFSSINLNLNEDSIIYSDNKQTLRLLQIDAQRLSTKLRHVDIHNMWLRQEVQAKRIIVGWIDTQHMVADGMTKALPPQRHQNFVELLSLVNIRHFLSKSSEEFPLS